MVALFGSSLLGTITGSTVANITITGAFTIPMMKKSGYRPEQAGVIETVSSNGGQLTRPIMGATAFLMAGYANIPYIEIVVAAIVSALLKFICVFFYITFFIGLILFVVSLTCQFLIARRLKIQSGEGPIRVFNGN
jgi:TRAP-type uncharacterized transport system fused permease subunit